MATTISSDAERRRRIGQLFIVGFDGYAPNEDIKTLIQLYHVGAVVLFTRNVRDADQLRKLCSDLQQLAKDAGHEYPLFIGIDQENGLVTRIKPPIVAQLPGAMALGATGDPGSAFKVACMTAETLKLLGINMNFSPVADINSEPENPVIGVRSFSDDPELVGKFVSEQIRGYRTHGIIPCIKHFPGHGDTAVDSHYGLPVITKDRFQLEDCEFIPFRRAAAEGVEAIMTAHIFMQHLEIDSTKHLPASLSPDIIRILREDWKYEGLIVSDCLEMDGIRSTFGTENGAVMALNAGTDTLMICHTMGIQRASIERVIKAVDTQELSVDRIKTSYHRVRSLKSRYLCPNIDSSQTSKLGTGDTLQDSSKVHQSPDQGTQAPEGAPVKPYSTTYLSQLNRRNSQYAAKVYDDSVTVICRNEGRLPISAHENSKVVYLSPGQEPLSTGVVDYGDEEKQEPLTPKEFLSILTEYQPEITEVVYHETVSMSVENMRLLEAANTVIMVTRNAILNPFQRDLGIKLGEKLGSKLIVIATCDPYDFQHDQEVSNYLMIYEPTLPAFRAAVDIIYGRSTALGKLPVSIKREEFQIEDLDVHRDIDLVFVLWKKEMNKWQIPKDRLSQLLNRAHGNHHVLYEDNKLVGFCIGYISDAGVAKVSVVCVATGYKGQGRGTALVGHARRNFQAQANFASLSAGSVFPRFWPGIPIDLEPHCKDYLLHRGFFKSKGPTFFDFYQDISNYVAPPSVVEKAKDANLSFSPWSSELYSECMTAQHRNFYKNPPWIASYERLAANNQYDEVTVAIHTDPTTGKSAQVGWTLACSPDSVFAQDFAFLPLCGPDTGVIACVGVDADARGKGVGTALLVHAMIDMKRRGVRGVLIDWVVIRGFYETLGFKPIWEYEGYEW